MSGRTWKLSDLSSECNPDKPDDSCFSGCLRIRDVGEDDTVDLRGVQITGKLDLRGCRFKQLDARGIKVTGEVLMQGREEGDVFTATNIERILLDEAEIGGDFKGGGLVTERLSMVLVRIGGVLVIRHNPDKEGKRPAAKLGKLDCHGVRVEGNVSLRGVEITGEAIFTNAQIGGMLIIRPWYSGERDDPVFLGRSNASENEVPVDTRILGGLHCARIKVGGVVDLSGAVIVGGADFDTADIGALYMTALRTGADKIPDEIFFFVQGGADWHKSLRVSETCRAWFWLLAAARSGRKLQGTPSEVKDENECTAVADAKALAGRVVEREIWSARLWCGHLKRKLNKSPDSFAQTFAERIQGLSVQRTNQLNGQFWSCDGYQDDLAGQKSGHSEPRVFKDSVDGIVPAFTPEALSYEGKPGNLEFLERYFSQKSRMMLLFGSLLLRSATVRGDLKARGALITKGIDASNSVFSGNFLVTAHVNKDSGSPTDHGNDDPSTVSANVLPSWVGEYVTEIGTMRCSVLAENLRVHGYVSFSGSVFQKGLNLLGSEVTGNVYLDKRGSTRTTVGVAKGPDGREYSARFSAMTIGGNLSFMGACLKGGMSIENSTIKGDVFGISTWTDENDPSVTSERRTYLGMGKWTKQERAALLANGVTVEGDIDLRGIFCDGGILIQNAAVGGSLMVGSLDRDISSAPKYLPSTYFETYASAYVGPAEDGLFSRSSIVTTGTTLGGDFDLRGAVLGFGVRMTNTKIGGHVLMGLFQSANGSVLKTPNVSQTVIGIGRGASADGMNWQESHNRYSIMGGRSEVGGHFMAQGTVFLSGVDLSGATFLGLVQFSKPAVVGDSEKDTEKWRTSVGLGKRRNQEYGIRLQNATVGNDLNFEGANFFSGVSQFAELGKGNPVMLDLRGAKVSGQLTLDDDLARLFPDSLKRESMPPVVLDLRDLTCSEMRLQRGYVDFWNSVTSQVVTFWPEASSKQVKQGPQLASCLPRFIWACLRLGGLMSVFACLIVASWIVLFIDPGGWETLGGFLALICLSIVLPIIASGWLFKPVRGFTKEILASGLKCNAAEFVLESDSEGLLLRHRVVLILSRWALRPFGHGSLLPFVGLVRLFLVCLFTVGIALFWSSLELPDKFASLGQWVLVAGLGAVVCSSIWGLISLYRKKVENLFARELRRLFLSRCALSEHPYGLLEDLARSQGHQQEADDTSLMWHSRSIWAAAGERPHSGLVWQALLHVLVGHGVRGRTLAYLVAGFILIGAALFSYDENVVIRPVRQGEVSQVPYGFAHLEGSGVPRSSSGAAMASRVATGFQIAFAAALPLGDARGPSGIAPTPDGLTLPIDAWGRRLALTGEGLAFLLRLLGWVSIPLLIGSLAKWIPRMNSRKITR